MSTVESKIQAMPLVIPVDDISSPTTQKALTVARKGEYEYVGTWPLPELQNENEVIIKNYATGLNPVDWKNVDYNFCLPSFPWITGREMAGVVQKVGSEVTTCKVGDKAWTSTYYRDRRAGCFQEFVTVPQHTVLQVPSDLNYEAAACLGVPALTAAMTLWKWLKAPQPTTTTAYAEPMIPTPPASPAPEEGYILIWGGSTITGQYAIQLAKASGLTVIAVSSSRTESLVLSLGADHVITRDNKTNAQILLAIQAIGGDNITRAIDIVGTTTSPFALSALSKTRSSHLAPLSFISKDEHVPENVTVHNIEMKQFILDATNRCYAETLNQLFEEKKLKEPQLVVLRGGLAAVPAGLEQLKQGDMGGKKLVVSLR